MAASASSALVLAAAALPEDDALLDEEELPEDDPEDPELEEVEAVEDEVEAEDSPALSVAVCEAVSQAATKKATATSAIRRCNMVMLPVLIRQRQKPGLQLVVWFLPVLAPFRHPAFDNTSRASQPRNGPMNRHTPRVPATPTLNLRMYYPKYTIKGNKNSAHLVPQGEIHRSLSTPQG